MTKYSLNRRIGPTMVIVLSIIPAIIWIFSKPFEFRFITLTATLTSLGQLSGLIGMSLFAFALVMSARLNSFDRFFGGLNKAYIFHHKAGIFAFLLILFHPLVLAFKYFIVSVPSAALFLIPNNDWALNYGIVGLWGMIFVIIITIYSRYRYEIVKLIHKSMGIIFFFAVLHMFYIDSDVSRDTILRTYMNSLAVFGLSAYLYRTLMGFILVKRYPFIVTNIVQKGSKIIEIVLKPLKKTMDYEPGQFVFVSFVSSGISKEVHPFSITSSPASVEMTLGIKNLGDYTSKLMNIETGSIAKVEGPYGMFFESGEHNPKQIWVGGGIGITPFVGMTRSLASRDIPKGYSIDLYYTAKTKEELVYLDDLIGIESAYGTFRVIPHPEKDHGFITAKLIAKLSGGLEQREIFICGPPSMMHSLTNQFRALGVPKRMIHTEEFQLLR